MKMGQKCEKDIRNNSFYVFQKFICINYYLNYLFTLFYVSLHVCFASTSCPYLINLVSWKTAEKLLKI